jgi:alkylation response protein AidB-like acyl-CoA dehydrogenase
MVSGEWTGTMNLTEPQAGSDLGPDPQQGHARRRRYYLIQGQKIWIIRFGEQDLTENIIHLVLARIAHGGPEGMKGISLFVVPKYFVGEDGSMGARNACELWRRWKRRWASMATRLA